MTESEIAVWNKGSAMSMYLMRKVGGRYTSYLILFLAVVFLVLPLVSAGIYVNDEWSTAQELNQIAQGHQITYNEGKYGYYENGSRSDYMEARHNILMYPAILPILSLPALYLIQFFGDASRAVIVLLWMLSGMISLAYTRARRHAVWAFLGVLGLAQVLLYTHFDFTSPSAPVEVAAIVLTNVLLYAGFIVTIYAITRLLWNDRYQRLFGVLAVIACSSAIWWIGTCKDHILVALLVALVAYSLLQYHASKRLPVLGMGAMGLLVWARPEIAFGVGIAGCIVLAVQNWRAAGLFFVGSGVASLPAFLNNYVVTGNLLKSPFLAANTLYGGSFTGHVQYSVNSGYYAFNPILQYPIDLFYSIAVPQSGSVGLLVVIPLFLLVVVFSPFILKTIRKEEWILLSMGLGVLAYQAIFWGFKLHSDTGITPDMRYFMPGYACLTLFGLSILQRLLDIKPKQAIRETFLFTMIGILLLGGIVITIPYFGESIFAFNRLVNTSMIGLFGISLLMLVNSQFTPRFVVPMLIAVPLVWQIVIAFTYGDIKIHDYAFFLPASEQLHTLIFRW